MGYKRYCALVLVFVICIFPCNVVLNYVLNPYEIFTHSLTPQSIFHNQRYEKIKYLQAHHEQFDSYLIGDSRVGLIKPELIESYLPNTRFYNMWVSSANPLDLLIFINYILENNYKVKYLLIQIGLDYGFNTIDYRVMMDTQRHWHYDVTHTSSFEFYQKYLFSFLFQGNYEKLKFLLTETELPQFEDIYTGVWGYTIRERQRIANPEQYAQNEPSFSAPQIKQQTIMSKKSLLLLKESLKGINTQCKTHGITCIIYSAPLHHTKINHFSPELRDFILRLLSDEFSDGFWHFAYFNSITTNNYNYYEDIHHIPSIDEMVLDRIFNKQTDSLPQDFGIFITKENIEQSLEAIHTIESRFD